MIWKKSKYFCLNVNRLAYGESMFLDRKPQTSLMGSKKPFILICV